MGSPPDVSREATVLRQSSSSLQFHKCTHSLGYIKQPVYYCQTCAEPRGLCTACSIACHGGHKLVELWQKRAFRCDCPTNAIPVPCVIHPCTEDPNDENVYSQNYHGVFCRCKNPYVAEEEPETKMQCAACEDWFHESCLHLRDKRPTQPVLYPDPALLIHPSTYEALICGSCVRKSPLFRRWAGSLTMRTIVWSKRSSKTEDGDWTVVRGQSCEDSEEWSFVDQPLQEPPSLYAPKSAQEIRRSTASMRRLPEYSNSARSDECCAPFPPTLIQRLVPPYSFEVPSVHKDELRDGDGEGDLFLSPGWAECLCRCSKCLPEVQREQYLMVDQELFEAPAEDLDPDARLTLEDICMRALSGVDLPREKALNAYNKMHSALCTYLLPYMAVEYPAGSNILDMSLARQREISMFGAMSTYNSTLEQESSATTTPELNETVATLVPM